MEVVSKKEKTRPSTSATKRIVSTAPTAAPRHPLKKTRTCKEESKKVKSTFPIAVAPSLVNNNKEKKKKGKEKKGKLKHELMRKADNVFIDKLVAKLDGSTLDEITSCENTHNLLMILLGARDRIASMEKALVKVALASNLQIQVVKCNSIACPEYVVWKDGGRSIRPKCNFHGG